MQAASGEDEVLPSTDKALACQVPSATGKRWLMKTPESCLCLQFATDDVSYSQLPERHNPPANRVLIVQL